MNKNYTVLHCHSSLSNAFTTLDSVTTFQQYIDRAKECNMTAFAFSEHGSLLEWWHKKCAIEKVGMKYLHATEAYITLSLDEKLRDNYHCLLIAKNYDGVRELNRLVSKSFNRNDNHFYYVPRILYDDLKSLSDNIIICSACIGGIFGKGDNELQRDFLKFMVKNKDRCYLEIQHHQTKSQIEHNQKLIKWHNQYGVPLVATTDTHCLNDTHIKGRSILQKSKNIYFEDEDGWDLTFKTYDELCNSFEKQGVEKDIYLEAIENTNVIANQVKEFSLDKNTKYPKIYDNSERAFKDKINKGYKENKYLKQRYDFKTIKKVYQEEFDTYKATKSIDFMMLQTYLREWEKNNGIQCGYGRGSVSGSEIAYTLGITQMDSMKFGLNFFRFQNPSRVTNCDIDTDYNSTDREKVKYFLLHDHMGLDNIQCAEIITFNTIALKGAIRDVGRALEMPLDIVGDICNNVEAHEDEMRKKYPELFEYVDIVNGAIVSIGSHPSGVLVTDKDIASEMGVCSLATSDYPVSMLNMKELDDLMYVKLDILGLDNIGVINETCKLANIERLTPDNVNIDDEKVWKSICDDTTLIFQWESDSASKYLSKFMSNETINKVKHRIKNFSYIKWFSFGNGLIRPACASYRDEIANGIFQDNGFKELDEFLAPTMGHVTMQEDIMQFLVKFCGYSQAESDTVRRGIAKKYGTEKLLPEIERRFIEYSSTHYDITKEQCAEIIKPFLQTILEASAYAFSWNHSDSYSCIAYISGYLRYYYPIEFLTSALNIFKDKEEKTLSITQYARKMHIQIKSPQFRHSRADYFCDKSNNIIYKGVGSIKNMNDKVAEELYELKDNQYSSFIDVLYELKNLSINSRQLDILVKIGYFNEFGAINGLLCQIEVFNKFYKCKTIKLDKAKELGYNIDILKSCCGKSTEKTLSQIDNRKLIATILSSTAIPSTTIQDRIKYQIELLGYTTLSDPKCDTNIFIVQKVETNNFGNTFVNLYSITYGVTKQFRVNKKFKAKEKLEVGDCIKCAFWTRDKFKKSEDGHLVKTGETFTEIKCWGKNN